MSSFPNLEPVICFMSSFIASWPAYRFLRRQVRRQNLSPNFAIMSSWSEPQSAPSLVFADCIERLHLHLQRIYQFDFGIDHLVMSIYRVISFVVEGGGWLWPVCSLGRTLLAFALLHSKAKLACYSRYLLTFYFRIPVPYDEKDILLCVLSSRSLVGLQKTVQLQLLWH